MDRRLLATAGLAALLLASLAPEAATARAPERFGRVDTEGRPAHLGRIPSQAVKRRLVTVAVELQGRPVSVYEGAALASGRSLSAARKQGIRALLARRQAAVGRSLAALGADVQFRFTDVLNGFRVRVRRGQLDEIRALPGVKAIRSVPRHRRANADTLAYLGADRTWARTGFTGRGVTIAVLDTGINYYHETFDGAGYRAWQQDNGRTRGDDFPTRKVVDGYDLVGDDYNADDLSPVQQPDPDPLDCKQRFAETQQHGTHVAGTAAGFGVTTGSRTFRGPWTPAALAATDLRIWPGVAPQAKLMAFRVFGCSGTTLVTADAIELAVRAGADVINLSLGLTLGNPGSLDAIAANNASLAGVTVVAASGNEGPSAYVTGSPASAIRAIAVAAVDAQPGYPGARIDLPSGPDIDAINANDAGLPVSGRLRYFRDDPDTLGDPSTGEGLEQSGCTPESFAYNGFQPGRVAVVQRGFCARTDKARLGQEEGAAAVVMVNNVLGLPPFEDRISGVTIPFIGVSAGADDSLRSASGTSVAIRSTGIQGNADYRAIADFSSAGPGRVLDLVKPDITAPGVSVFSADGYGVARGKSMSGTSMASPAVAGVAALVKQAHPGWLPRDIKAAIVGTAAAGKVDPYQVRFAGAGVAQPRRAVDTQAFVRTEPGSSSLAFGYQPAELRAGTRLAFTRSRKLTIVNTGPQAIRYHLANAFQTPSRGAGIAISPSVVTVPAGGERSVTVTVSLTEARATSLPSGAPGHEARLAVDPFGQVFTDIVTIAGAITATPDSSGPGIYPLRVPWQVVPRPTSQVQDLPGTRPAWAADGDRLRSSIGVRNFGLRTGIADVFAWGLVDAGEDGSAIDLRAAGVQALPASVCDSSARASDRCLVFAINLFGTFDSAAANEYDIVIDLDGDDIADRYIASLDLGLSYGTEYGVAGSVVIDLESETAIAAYYTAASSNGSTVLMAALTSDLGLRPNGRRSFRYWAESYEVYDDDGTASHADLMTTGAASETASLLARFDPFDPVLNASARPRVAPGETRTISLVLDPERYRPARRGQKGWLIVSLDDENGALQADMVPVGPLP